MLRQFKEILQQERGWFFFPFSPPSSPAIKALAGRITVFTATFERYSGTYLPVHSTY